MTRHRVTWTTGEDGDISGVSVECLADPGAWCRRGCPVPECEDWSHWGAREAGCEHCEDLCDCDCDCSDTLRNDPQWACPGCPTALSHGGDCPHRWVDLDHCWVLADMWAWGCDADPRRRHQNLRGRRLADIWAWGYDADPPTVPPGHWSITYHGWTTSDVGTITLLDPGHPVRVIQPQGGTK